MNNQKLHNALQVILLIIALCLIFSIDAEAQFRDKGPRGDALRYNAWLQKQKAFKGYRPTNRELRNLGKKPSEVRKKVREKKKKSSSNNFKKITMEKMIITGRVGKDAEIKLLNGVEYTAFSVAVDTSYKKQDGTKVEQANWYSCLKQGAGLAPYIKKGQFLTVFGRPNFKVFIDAQNRPQVGLNVNVSDVALGPNPNAGQAENTPTTHTPRAEYQTAQPASNHPIQSNILDDMANDDLPF